MNENVPLLFISYSKQDEEEKDKLISQLGVLEGAGRVGLWTEDRVGVGENWRLEMSQAIAQARVAVLLVTANFLNSEIILERVVPELIRRHRNEDLVVLPVIARACAWQAFDWLRELEVRPRNGVPVWSEGGIHVDEYLSGIAEEIFQIVEEDTGELSGPRTTLVGGQPFVKGDAGSKRVLIVEDDVNWQKRLARIVREIDCMVDTADNYEQAEPLLSERAYNLVTVDLNLDTSTSYADGLELVRKIRQQYGTRIPIIIITGTGNLEEQRRAFKDYNVVDFIQKERFDFDEFRDVVKGALAGARPQH
jgi:CheY-like chemotaxis protein